MYFSSTCSVSFGSQLVLILCPLWVRSLGISGSSHLRRSRSLVHGRSLLISASAPADPVRSPAVLDEAINVFGMSGLS